jgi:hypothetical protein
LLLHATIPREGKTRIKYMRSEVLVAVTLTSTISWDVTPYSLVEVYCVSEEHNTSIMRVKEKVAYLAYSWTLKVEAVHTSKLLPDYTVSYPHSTLQNKINCKLPFVP